MGGGLLQLVAYGAQDAYLSGNVRRKLDMAEVEKAHQLYLQHGLGARDDAVAMQYLIPGWKFDHKRPCMVR